MRALTAALAVLALLTFLPTPAAAQTQGHVTVQLNPPEEALSPDVRTLTFTGIVTLTTDATAYAGLMGVPVTYTVTKQPAWTTVTISPSSDVFNLGATPGLTYTSTKTFTITVNLQDEQADDLADEIQITATTSSAAPFGSSFTGRGAAPIVYDAPEAEPCPEHAALSNVDWASVAVEAADAYNERQSAKQGGGDEVSVQTGGSTTLSTPWLVVGGFALVGAGVGLVLRRRLG